MEILLYYVLRRFFCELRVDGESLYLRKGLILRRESRIALSSVLCADITATPAMRLIGARKVTLSTLSGKFTFFLSRKELPTFSGKAAVRPSALSVIFGAFIDTRALSGAAAFAYALRRAGRLFGSSYTAGLISAISDTADELSRLMTFLNVAVPRFTAAAAVFIAFAWLFSFALKLVKLSRFRVVRRKDLAVISHGCVTLYVRIIPLGAPCVFSSCDTVTTLLFGAAPVYFMGGMVFPPIRRKRLRSLARAMFSLTLPRSTLRPPRRAMLGYAALPLWWTAGFSAAAIFTSSLRLLSSLMWGAAAWCAWLALAYALFAGRAEFSCGGMCAVVSSRRASRLHTSFFRRENITGRTLMQNIFQQRSGLCDIMIYACGSRRMRFRLAQTAWVRLSGFCR